MRAVVVTGPTVTQNSPHERSQAWARGHLSSPGNVKRWFCCKCCLKPQ